MNLIISCELTAPPSEIGAFRNLTHYATVFKKMDCLVEAEPDEVDFYYTWLKRNYAYDFVKQFVKKREVSGIRLNYDRIQRLTFNNLNDMIFVVSMAK